MPSTSIPPPGNTLETRIIRHLLHHRTLTILLALYCLFLLFCWAPHYLTWPWWADHDVFATAALSWHHGELPYRDIPGNNFPGTTYLFYLLGITCGWGRTSPLWAFDLALLLAFLSLLLAWSRARFASLLPGLVASLATLTYYLNQDYSQAAQRDWHAPLLALASLMLAQAVPSLAGQFLSGLVMALALSVRPQAILLAPAILASTLWLSPSNQTQRKAAKLAAWALGLALGAALVVAPLARHHLIPDFLQGLRLVSYGGPYSQLTPLSIARELIQQLLQPRISLTIALLATLAFSSTHKRQTLIALLALAGVYLYRPLSPAQHAYLSHPLLLTWCWSLATLCALIFENHQPATDRLKLLALTLLIALAAPAFPRFCNVQASLNAALHRNQSTTPPGYTANPEASYAAQYDWTDYHATLQFLRQQTDSSTRVANALRFSPALTGPTARLSAFPAESIAWLTIVRPEDEPRFANRLTETPNSVVVWDPTTTLPPTARPLPLLEAAIRAHYHPWKVFGVLEVWKRNTPPEPHAPPAPEPK